MVNLSDCDLRYSDSLLLHPDLSPAVYFIAYSSVSIMHTLGDGRRCSAQ